MQILLETRNAIRSWEFFDSRKNAVLKPLSVRCLIATVTGVLSLWKLLKDLGFSNLATRSLNQDPLENFFGVVCVRALCGQNQNPTCSQFVSAFKTNLINSSFKNALTTNCERDEHEFLLFLNSLSMLSKSAHDNVRGLFPIFLPYPAVYIVLLNDAGKSRTSLEGYRPISLLSTIGKLFERVVLTHLQQWVDESGLLPDEQHGFRRQHSTVHQLLRVAEHITQAWNWHSSVCAMFLDVAKAFDKVWHEGLIFKLSNANAPTWLVRLLDSYLSGRRFRVKIGDARSTARPITAGVPQGSALAPLLYNIYSADMSRPPRNVVHAQYADDTAILSRSTQPTLARRRLQEAAHNLEDWYRAWRIHVNASKSVAVHFTRQRRPAELPTAKIFGEDVPWQPQVKYLGVILDSRLSWRPHVADANRRARGVSALLSGLTCRRSKLSLGNKLLLYRAVVRPLMTYAAPIWGYAGLRVLAPLQVTQNLFLRTACDAPWYIRNVDIHDDLHMEPVETYVKKLATRFFTSVANHTNSGIAAAGSDYSAEDAFRFPRPKHILRADEPAS